MGCARCRMRLSFLIISLLFWGVIADNIINYRDLADRRLCNNVGSDGYMCKVRREPNLEGGGDIPCDNRKLRPEQCQEVIIETLHSALSEVFAGLPELDTNLNVRRIAITLTGNNTHDSEAVDIGHHIDNFLKSRMWWYVTKEPYIWSPPSKQHHIVLSRVQHQFEPSLRVISALQFPETQDVCKKTPLVLHHRDFKHPGWYSMLAQYQYVHDELPYAITGVYVSSANSVNDSTSFVSAEDCPDVVNKWECAFLPVTSCALPVSVTHCHASNCVVQGVQDTMSSSAVYDSASEEGNLIVRNSPELLELKRVMKLPPSINEKMMREMAIMAATPQPETHYGKPMFPKQAPFHRMMFSDVDNYAQGLLLRPSAFYRSRIADTIHHFQQDTGFASSQRCVAAQIRRGDRAAAHINITEFCLNPANRHSDFGCADVPFASVTLRHVVESAAKLVDASVRSLVVTTDDEAWLDAQRVELRKTHPEWRVYNLQAPTHTHRSHHKDQLQVPLKKNDEGYQFMRYGAGTQSGVLLHGSIELSRQCEAFVGHFGCGGTMLVYKALCAQSNHREHVCPPSFDVRSIKELRIYKEGS